MISKLKESFFMLSRRKSRTIPAALAAAAGIFLLIVTASVSSYFLELSNGLSSSFSGRVFLCEKKNFWIGGGLIPQEKLSGIQSINELQEAVPMLISRASSDDLVMMGIPDMMIGIPLDKTGLYVNRSAVLEGCLNVNPGDLTAGWDIAKKYGLKVGGFAEFKGKKYRIAGILKKTSSVLDRQIIVSLPEMQVSLEREGLLTCIMGVPALGASSSDIASKVKSKAEYIQTVSSSDIEKDVHDTVDFWNSLTAVFFLISGLGSLMSVSAVTAMSVTERKTEIAVKKALGAENRHIYAEFLSESLLLTFLAWILGLAGACGFVAFCDACPFTGSAAVFRLEPVMVLASLVWSLLVASGAVYIPLRGILKESPAALLRGL